MRSRIFALALAAALALVPTPGTPAELSPAGVSDLASPALALSDQVRAAAQTGSLAQLLRTAITAGGADAPTLLHSAPADLAPQDPLADLIATVTAASAHIERAIAGADPSRVAALTSSGLGALEVTMPADRPDRMPSPAASARALEATATAWDEQAAVAETAVANALRGVDRHALTVAALEIVAALDRVLPHLSAAVPTGVPVAGCDVLDQPPLVCVGGAGDNTYTDEYALVVDLGGDDTYRNAAGGVNPVDPRVGGPVVSVNVDLAGNDTYDHVTPHDVPRPAQGAALIGVGILVDVAGDDTYRHRTVPGEDTELTLTSPRAQGNGSLAGVGLLADLAGNDTYLIDQTAYPSDRSVDAMGQGLGIAGTGVLYDAAGDDTYRIESGTASLAAGNGSEVTGAKRVAAGQGTGSLGGTGLLVDGGGTDLLRLAAHTATPAAHTTYEDFAFPGPPAVELRGQGVGSFEGAPGLVVTGEGDTTYEVVATGTGLGQHNLFGQGFGLGGGVAALDDAGGNDRYLLSSEMHARLEVTGTDAEAVLWGFRPSATQNVMGQGFAFHGLAGQPALGVLRDGGGADRYEARHIGTVDATVVATAGRATATAVSFDGGPLWVQGTGVDQSVGVLLDAGGDDAYVAVLAQTASARAEGATGETAGAIATPLGLGFVDAQGATSNDSAGVLADLGGRDHYEARGRMRAFAHPTVGGAIEVGGFGLFQGSGPDAVLLDVDQGEADTSRSEPNFGDTCVGHRGEAPGWSECPVERSSRPDTIFTPYRPLGSGIMTSAPVKDEPAVVLAGEETSGAPDGVLFVDGTLTGPDGEPLAGREVDVRLQRLIVDAEFGVPSEPQRVPWWLDMTAIHAVTGDDGTFTAALRLPDFDTDLPPYRVWVGYSGDETLRPAADTLTFTFGG